MQQVVGVRLVAQITAPLAMSAGASLPVFDPTEKATTLSRPGDFGTQSQPDGRQLLAG